MAVPPEREVTALARRLAELGTGEQARVYRMSWWNERLMERAMADPAFRTQLFRFVDVFPATSDPRDVLDHVSEYFAGDLAPRPLRAGMRVARSLPGAGGRVTAAVAARSITRMARQFIAGTTAAEATERLGGLWRDGAASTVDLLGEKTIVEDDADRYAHRAHALLDALTAAAPHWPAQPVLEADDLGPLPRVNLSIKPTALASKFAPLTGDEGIEQAKGRIRPMLRRAVETGAHVHFDMEHHDVKDLTLRLLRELLDEDEFGTVHAGCVIQAYLRDSYDDLAAVIAWSARRARPVTVRLVKGAYWDTETVVARAAGWPVPVYEHKDETDANYERCTRALHEAHGAVRAAFGSHNLRSLAYAVASARQVGIPDDGYELQMLHGMAEPLQAAITRMGLRLRLYAPVGELVPGMAYLVRRLLENTSNESFVRHRFAEGRALDELLEPPAAGELPPPAPAAATPATDAVDPAPYEPEPSAEWWRADVRAGFAVAVSQQDGRNAVDVPAVIAGERVRTSATIESPDPADPERLVAVSASCGTGEADAAIAAADAAWPAWRATPPDARAAVLFRAAAWMRERRAELGALEVSEAGKPWAEADADVCEAIDFCEYYGREMRRMAQGGVVQSPPGEDNRLLYQPRGIVAVIAPWNFPLAIPTGMVAAALVSGNCALFKPAEQTPAIAARLVDALVAGGLPPGVLAFLPGTGEDVGAHLVAHPQVAMVAFTGSMQVGLAINEAAAHHRPGQRHVKRVVAEMGGKNAVIVDADADPDVAVPAVVTSAFGYGGQKCSAASRLIVLDAVYDDVVDRVVRAAAELTVGHPRHMGTQLGPLIDADAHKRVVRYTETASEEGTVLLQREDVPDRGWFVGPMVVSDVARTARVAREEVFGPVLTVFRAADFDDALAIANDTDFALTAGVISRSPAHIRRAAAELRAGNVYVNRGITGAVVGRQPFGGFGLSGVGSKAGGPDYLLQFVEPRVVTENTLRQGFVPESS